MHRPLKFTLFLLLCLAVAGLNAQEIVDGPVAGSSPEIDPVLRPDGQELFFTRPDFINNKGTDNAADIWIISRYADGSWGRALNPGSPINSFAHDRALAFSPDGNRLAVLRTGAVSYIDLLESSGRNWRILDSWPIPEGVAPRYDVTFNPNAQQLIYSAYQNGNLDLFRRDALPNGKWSKPQQLREANGPGNETAPSLAADGRTLYFQRDGGRWFRQLARGTRPEMVNIPAGVQQFSTSLLSPEIVAVMPASATRKRFLQVLPVTAEVLPPAVTLVRGYLPSPPPMGEQTARIALANGPAIIVRPDALNRYSLFLRQGESLANSTNLSASTNGGQNQSSLATAGNLTSSPSADRQRLEAGIARRQRELDQLDAERRKYDLVAPKTVDPELAALRDQYSRSLQSPADTLPPTTDARENTRTDRYAAQLTELERMKEKFRRQQNEKLGLGNQSAHQWNEKSPAAAGHSSSRIGESYQAQLIPRTAAERERAYNDSLRLAAEIRAGLSHNKAPRVYERAAWENDVRQGLPRTDPLSPEEIAELDADYQRQLRELEALRAELRRLENQPATPSTYGQTGPPRTWSAKDASEPDQTVIPSNYSTPSGNVPASVGRGAPMPAGISFIPNTAYPDSRGYTGLDQLVGLIKQSTSVLEIRVHTPAELAPRAAQLLSEERATTIRNFLVDKGIPSVNYQIIGFGNNLTGEQGERVEVLR